MPKFDLMAESWWQFENVIPICGFLLYWRGRGGGQYLKQQIDSNIFYIGEMVGRGGGGAELYIFAI
jgi:hypothetical protein